MVKSEKSFLIRYRDFNIINTEFKNYIIFTLVLLKSENPQPLTVKLIEIREHLVEIFVECWLKLRCY